MLLVHYQTNRREVCSYYGLAKWISLITKNIAGYSCISLLVPLPFVSVFQNSFPKSRLMFIPQIQYLHSILFRSSQSQNSVHFIRIRLFLKFRINSCYFLKSKILFKFYSNLVLSRSIVIDTPYLDRGGLFFYFHSIQNKIVNGRTHSF